MLKTIITSNLYRRMSVNEPNILLKKKDECRWYKATISGWPRSAFAMTGLHSLTVDNVLRPTHDFKHKNVKDFENCFTDDVEAAMNIIASNCRNLSSLALAYGRFATNLKRGIKQCCQCPCNGLCKRRIERTGKELVDKLPYMKKSSLTRIPTFASH